MEKTEEKKYLDDKITEWMDNNKKLMWIIRISLYIVFVIIFIIITINMNGGIQNCIHNLNYYPEQEYSQLEQEVQNIIVESDGIYPEKLSNDSIYYEISYKKSSDFEGQYTIKLIDDVTVTATIGEDLKKANLIIEREYESAEYRRNQYVSDITGTLLIPLLALVFLYFLKHVLLLAIFITEVLIEKICKNKK